MRVVAGTARGRKLQAPPGDGTRPTSDRVREALFNALASLDAVDDAVVLDLFGGSGALGIEALSRGARHATIVDSDRSARAVIEANLAATGFAAAATVVGGDALAHLARTADRYDLVLLDPPYAFADWPGLLQAVTERLAEDALVVIESRDAVAVPAPLGIIREKRYGSTVVTFAHLPTTALPQAGDSA